MTATPLPATPATPRLAAHARRLAIAAAVVAGVLLGGCSGGSSTMQTSASTGAGPRSPSGFDGAALPAGIGAPGFTLVDQQGRRVSLASYRGKVTILTFLYPACGPCVLVAQQIRGALDQLAHPVPVLVVSAEPAADTPANISRFLAHVSLAGRVEYLSGSARQLEGVWRAYRITPPSSSRRAFERAISVLLIGPNGEQRVAFGIEQLTPESLAHDIGKLQNG